WEEQKPIDEGTPLEFIDNSLTEGWSFEVQAGGVLHLLTDGEIFGWRRPETRRRARPVAEAPEAGYTDLQFEDYVVHVDHGIGRYLGLVRRAIDGVEREYLTVEYADEAQLFVPIHQADRLTRYVGPDNRTPTLSRLGSTEWKGTKSHVKEAVKEVAEELLELYAKRSVVSGYSFAEDSTWQQELEASFPYIETDDQTRVIAEVKRDMQSKRPMDRLICGDVGYGKTEVALRAAFKAVIDNRQTAILVPTTVLAQQHYNTFSQRLAAFPVTVEMLSRFRTAQQQREILARLEKGQVDILIGTHRLLSSDVKFKDMGLLIIDEEQRFGVTHKEALKKMRTEVDVLTLTATPIPRTLYMALSGVRDISTINTPPEERLPIVTHVGPYSPKLVKQAILRELERGGQIFFVHNRVQTIGAMLSHLKQLVPEARIVVAHGQMAETELAHRMEEFSQGEVDILLSTSIIESGLDIPNANTLIVDRADTFGLAQLYQLRGRVGRGAQRAYAYFFRHNRKSPTYEGRQRLETIAENTQLGAGYSIAMRDLEIRGTGDILGTRQHGHIAAVGFHLYTALLAEAVRRMRKEQGLPAPPMPSTLNLQLNPVNVELPLPVAIPADYVADKNVRLGLYRRMADMRSLAELDALTEEFQDRFGPPPPSVTNLLYQLKVKLLAERAGLASIGVEGKQIVLRYPEGVIPEDLPDLGPHIRVGKVALWLGFTELEGWMEYLFDILQKLQTIEAVTTPA
ncbi:MAG: transcription-repair coupling factor, partial [Chloroflexi bacterium RBG_16_57_11]